MIQNALFETIGWLLYSTHFYEIVLRAHRLALEDVDEQREDSIGYDETQEDVVSIQPLFRSQPCKASVEQGDGNFDQASGDKEDNLFDTSKLRKVTRVSHFKTVTAIFQGTLYLEIPKEFHISNVPEMFPNPSIGNGRNR